MKKKIFKPGAIIAIMIPGAEVEPLENIKVPPMTNEPASTEVSKLKEAFERFTDTLLHRVGQIEKKVLDIESTTTNKVALIDDVATRTFDAVEKLKTDVKTDIDAVKSSFDDLTTHLQGEIEAIKPQEGEKA